MTLKTFDEQKKEIALKSQRAITRIKNGLQIFLKEKNMVYLSLPIIFIGLIYVFSKYADNQAKIFHTSSEINFSGGRVLDNRGRDIYKRRKWFFLKNLRLLKQNLKALMKSSTK